jgi:hypothetical protein
MHCRLLLVESDIFICCISTDDTVFDPERGWIGDGDGE